MATKALQARKSSSARQRLQRDFAAFTLQEKKEIKVKKAISESKFKKGLVELKQSALTENRSAINLKKQKILEEVFKYEDLCIMEAISDQTVGDITINSESINKAIQAVGSILPSVAKRSKMHFEKIEAALDAMVGQPSNQRAYLSGMKDNFKELVKLYKFCDALGESMTYGEIHKEIMLPVREWMSRFMKDSGASDITAFEDSMLFQVFSEYDTDVKVSGPVAGVPQKMGVFSKIFGKKPTAQESKTEKRFENLVFKLFDMHMPGGNLAYKIVDELLGHTFTEIKAAFNAFSAASGDIDEKVILDLTKTGWLGSIKDFLMGGGGGRGIRLF